MQIRRVLHDEGRQVELCIEGARLTERTPLRTRALEHPGALEALVALHRRIHALSLAGMVEDPLLARGVVALSPPLESISIELPLGRAELERRLGEALTGLGAQALAHAAPLLLLSWPVGYRFAALFEARPRDRGGRDAVARAIAAHPPSDAAAAAELLRVALVQRNAAALAPALALLPAVRSFDSWMDVLELADDVGDRRHVPMLRALARGRVPADAREPLGELTREIQRRG